MELNIILHSLSNQIQLTCIDQLHSVSTETIGSAISVDVFHHIFLSIQFIPKDRLYQVSIYYIFNSYYNIL